MTRPKRNRILSAVLGGAGLTVGSLVTIPAMAHGSIVVRDFVLSHGIQEREPVNNTDSFRVEDGRAFAFARIHNTGDPTTVSFIWHHGKRHHATVAMNVGKSPGWRTWSTAKLQAGNWRVKLVDIEGEVLLEKAFSVDPGSAGLMASPPNSGQDDGDMMKEPNDIPASVIYPAR